MSLSPAHGGFTRPLGGILPSRRRGRQARAFGFFVLLLGYSQIASADPAQISCTNQSGPPPTVRAEGIAELVGDVVLSCTGGMPTPIGAPVPLAKVQVFLNNTKLENINVTSRLLASSGLSEATLLIDDPEPAIQILCMPQGNPCAAIGGAQRTPNVFNATMAAPNSVVWLGVPFDPPGIGAPRKLRITNVRAKCAPDCVMSIVVTCSQSVVIDKLETTVAVAAPGLVATVAPTTLSQCQTQCRGDAGFDFAVTVTEGFPGAFRPRIAGPGQGDPSTLGPKNGFYAYGTESGFYAPNLFPPPPPTPATPAAGLADFGTRIRLVFTPVAAGVELFVPVDVFSGGLHLGLVQAGPNGDSPRLPPGSPPTLIPPTDTVRGVAQVSLQGDQAYAVYEVLSAGPTATIPVAVMLNGNPPNFPPPGAVMVSVSLVPIGGPGSMTASVRAPLPRFVDTSVPQVAFKIETCILYPFKCEVTAAAATVRSEGITELVGDLVLMCTGGFPTQKGAPIPATDIHVSLNTSVTSRILAPQLGLSEATLLIDEPNSGPTAPALRSCCTANLAGNSCPETGTGFGCQSPYFAQPNIFLGWQSDSKTIVFKQVPIDQPGPGGTLILRITNVRANASQASGAPIMMTVSVTGPQSPAIDKSDHIVAILKPGLVVGNITNTHLSKCKSLNAGLLQPGGTGKSTFQITVSEGFPSSLKPQIADHAQNVPGHPYYTESGFYDPPSCLNAGLADSGTGLRVRFQDVGEGAHLFVPAVLQTDSATLRLVETPGGRRVRAAVTIDNAGPAAEISVQNGSASAIYEVLAASPRLIETVTIPVAVAFEADLAQNPPAPGQVKVSVSLAPVSGLADSAIPRFDDTSKPQDAYAIDPCPPPLPPFVCTASAVPELVRAEGIAEQVGDLVLNCTGGVPTKAGAQVPLYNVQIFVNTNVTSRIVGNGNLSEATLMIDEPLPPPLLRVPRIGMFSGPRPPQVLCTPQGNPCSIVGDGFGTPYETIPGTPTVYSGRQATAGSVSWNGVPIDAPGTGNTRAIRITNVRANACQLGVSSILLPTPIVMLIAVNGSSSDDPHLTIDKPRQRVAFIQPGLIVGGTTASLSQCIGNNPGLIALNNPITGPDFQIRVTEGFASSFKRRNIALTCDGTTAPAPRAQNIPGYPYNTESGFYNPALFTATPVVGLADFGTRIRIAFNNIGAGVNVFVPVSVPLVIPGTSTTTTPAQPVSPVCPPMDAGGITNGRLTLVQTDSFGNSVPGFTAIPATVVIAGGLAPITSSGADSGYAVYEVVNSDVNVIERANIDVYVAFIADTSNNLPGVGQTTVSVSFAPAGRPLADIQTADPTAPIPRFCDNSTPRNAFAINSCNLLSSLCQGCAFISDTALDIAAEGYLGIELGGLAGENKGH